MDKSRVVIPPFDGPFPGATLGATSGVTTPSKISHENQALKCQVRRVSPIFSKDLGDSEKIRTFAPPEPAKPLHDAQMCGSFYNSSVMTDEFFQLQYNSFWTSYRTFIRTFLEEYVYLPFYLPFQKID